MKTLFSLRCAVRVAALLAGAALPAFATEPNLTIGVVSDIHMETSRPRPRRVFRDALRLFDAKRVDGVIACGDLTQDGEIPQLEVVAQVWREVFPGNRRSDGASVEKLFVYGDHDVERFFNPGQISFMKAHPECIAAIRRVDIPSNDRALQWARCFGEPFAPIMRKRVKGYDFVLAHLVNRDEDGLRYAEPLYIPGLEAFFATNAFDRARPFFYVQHKIPRGTVGGPTQSGQDAGRTTATLSRYPNAVGFNGHKHRAATEELSLWQGAFTQIQAPALATLLTAAGRENGRCSCESPCATPPQQMAQLDTTGDGSHALVMRVYNDRLVIERLDVVHAGEPVAEPWTVRLPNDGSASFEARGRTAGVPQFAPGATVAWRRRPGKNRRGATEDQVEVTFPPARRTAATPRAYDYEVTAVIRKGAMRRIAAQKRVYSPKCYFPEAHDAGPVVCVFAKSEISDNHDTVEFEVRPLNAWGAAGEAIRSERFAFSPVGALYPF